MRRSFQALLAPFESDGLSADRSGECVAILGFVFGRFGLLLGAFLAQLHVLLDLWSWFS
jgi:hypothetical protein